MAARLLLVDDEPALAELLQRYLQRIGYEVDVCGSAEEALARFEPDPSRYPLVLTDLTLPGMNGDDMLERMRLSDPALRAILSSGYPHTPRNKETRFLPKPFLPKVLVTEIEALLGRASAETA